VQKCLIKYSTVAVVNSAALQKGLLRGTLVLNSTAPNYGAHVTN